jgi:hypothetical protein
MDSNTKDSWGRTPADDRALISYARWLGRLGRVERKPYDDATLRKYIADADKRFAAGLSTADEHASEVRAYVRLFGPIGFDCDRFRPERVEDDPSSELPYDLYG